MTKFVSAGTEVIGFEAGREYWIEVTEDTDIENQVRLL